jgi:hypothetical protein
MQWWSFCECCDQIIQEALTAAGPRRGGEALTTSRWEALSTARMGT